MSSDDVIIRAQNLSKVYRLYAKPHYRFLDMFGLLRKRGVYTEHMALDGINLEIRRGERVAFIGRNGAGKSTLLKLITGVIQPSAGSLTVTQGAHALLQIGTGFHPDFTGRQNAIAYLAHLGVAGDEAEKKIAAIIDFAELEEYVDQPIKTYSTGMVARLMFATSTIIEPELLVLDEILGVGDAYFSQKSFERIREMCEQRSTTVLLVSHDIYTTAKLCDRMVWIDRGRIVFDGSAQDAMRAYETSIREQEEKRLRAKKMLAVTERKVSSYTGSAVGVPVIVEIMAPEPLGEPFYFGRIAFCSPGHWEVELPVIDANGFCEENPNHLIMEGSSWSEEISQIGEHPCREMRAFGSPFHKVSGMLRVPEGFDAHQQQLQVKCAYRATGDVGLKITCFNAAGARIFTGELPPSNGKWVPEYTVAFQQRDTGEAAGTARAIGTNRIQILDARFVDLAGEEVFFIRHGEPAHLLIDFQINDPSLAENAQVAIALHRDGTVDTCRFLTEDLFFDGQRAARGTIAFSLKHVPISEGKYTITVFIAQEGYYTRQQSHYFSINPGVYSCWSRMFEIEVIGGTALSAGTVFVGEADWSIRSPLGAATNADG